MNWLGPIDNYCERLDASFTAEPLNAISNAAFIIAAFLLLREWKRPIGDLLGLALILNIFIIGIGSSLFHTFANRWSELADVLPIAVFIHFYLVLALHRFLGLRWWAAIGVTLIFLIASPFMAKVMAPIAGSSAFYLPALFAIVAVALAARRTNNETSNNLIAAGAVFTLSIAFRAADQPLCPQWPMGTHMLWHVLNGLVLYLLVRLCLKSSAVPAAH